VTIFPVIANTAPPLAAEVTKGLYARTVPSPSGEATVRPICTDPNNAGYIWAFGATSLKIGYTPTMATARTTKWQRRGGPGYET
jgi:hypothetical protein